jgi:hypothetical protein
MASPYSANPPGAEAARAMLTQSVPLDLVQPSGMGGPLGPMNGIQPVGAWASPGAGSGIMLAGGQCGAGNCSAGMAAGPPGAVAAVGALTGGAGNRFPSQRTSVRFLSPAGMKVSWYTPSADGRAGFNTVQVETPGRYNFVQAAIYRLKLSNIANRPGLELYPTLEVLPTTCKTESFLAHSAVPITFTDEDFEQVAAGNFLVKVIYLPDPQFQDVATTAPDEVVSSRLEPGADPIAEAKRRGSILVIVRLGNIDLEAPNTPSMDAPNPYTLKCMVPQGYPATGRNPMMPTALGMLPGANPMMPASHGPVTAVPPPPMPVGPMMQLPETTEVKPAGTRMGN